MEEASHLASRAAILSKGILALGSTKNLRMKWVDVYLVHFVLKIAPESGREEMKGVERWVKERFEGAKVDGWGSVGGQVFSIPESGASGAVEGEGEGEGERERGEGMDEMEISRVGGERGDGIGKGQGGRKGGVAELFRKLEVSKEELGLVFYVVRVTSMGEVFLNVREEEGRGK